ncbi:hypothetical protein Pla52o_25020 [Novipirellula galeiformis]|uniref:Uncharacterized protein n=1 Tax=Novipirellula galeiformis TaxID=2528004 RepID=A0A5C6CJI7_9BACT|nr:hypothetical protein Pla52o_25020 [Novipirellula galeiformis]
MIRSTFTSLRTDERAGRADNHRLLLSGVSEAISACKSTVATAKASRYPIQVVAIDPQPNPCDPPRPIYDAATRPMARRFFSPKRGPSIVIAVSALLGGIKMMGRWHDQVSIKHSSVTGMSWERARLANGHVLRTGDSQKASMERITIMKWACETRAEVQSRVGCGSLGGGASIVTSKKIGRKWNAVAFGDFWLC